MCAPASGFPSRVILPETGASPADLWQPAAPRAIMPTARNRNGVSKITTGAQWLRMVSGQVPERNCLFACRCVDLAVADRALGREDDHVGVNLDGAERAVTIGEVDD